MTAALDCRVAVRRLLRLYAERSAPLWKRHWPLVWLKERSALLLRRLDEAHAPTLELAANCAAARAAAYGGAPAMHDEFADADASDFSLDLPAQMPADEGGGDDDLGPGRWAPPPGRPPRPPGRLVVPREEWLELRPDTNPLVQFFLSMLPWAVPTTARRRGN